MAMPTAKFSEMTAKMYGKHCQEKIHAHKDALLKMYQNERWMKEVGKMHRFPPVTDFSEEDAEMQHKDPKRVLEHEHYSEIPCDFFTDPSVEGFWFKMMGETKDWTRDDQQEMHEAVRNS